MEKQMQIAEIIEQTESEKLLLWEEDTLNVDQSPP